jgi:hypothetical protein
MLQTPRPPNMAPCPLGPQNPKGLIEVPISRALHNPSRAQKSRGGLQKLDLWSLALVQRLTGASDHDALEKFPVTLPTRQAPRGATSGGIRPCS